MQKPALSNPLIHPITASAWRVARGAAGSLSKQHTCIRQNPSTGKRAVDELSVLKKTTSPETVVSVVTKQPYGRFARFRSPP
jgi:hypothetical protein